MQYVLNGRKRNPARTLRPSEKLIINFTMQPDVSKLFQVISGTSGNNNLCLQIQTPPRSPLVPAQVRVVEVWSALVSCSSPCEARFMLQYYKGFVTWAVRIMESGYSNCVLVGPVCH